MTDTNRPLNVLPLRHVLCPMDLSPISVHALAWANAVAWARNAELRMLHVVATDGVVAADHLGFIERDRLMEQLRETQARIDPSHPQVGAAIRQGDPGTQVLQFARSISADLIVMGAAGMERPERPVGSVTATVVARSQCPVMIVPSGRPIDASRRRGYFEHIVCAVDVTPASIMVIKQALALAWETRGRVILVCVTTGPSLSASDIRERLLEAIPADARTWCDLETVVAHGDPATEIAGVAERGDVDLLVIGPPRRWTSTTEAVLARSICPVLVTHDARPLPYPGAGSGAPGLVEPVG